MSRMCRRGKRRKVEWVNEMIFRVLGVFLLCVLSFTNLSPFYIYMSLSLQLFLLTSINLIFS
jgi:hypothetical protein